MSETLIPFDNRDGVIWLDGQMVPWREAKIHVLTHGLHYASSVFEGERAYGGEIFKLTEHSERLKRSAELIGFSIPYSVAEIDRACRDVVKAMGFQDCYVRPVAWRGAEQMGISSQKSKIHLAIAAWQWPAYFDPALKAKGIRMTISRWKRPAPDTAPTASKAAGLYMICTMSKHEAENAGYTDALFYDYKGHIAEATGAHLFFAMNGMLHTPTLGCILDGITRRTIIELAGRRNIPVHERDIRPEEMANAQEAFLVGTAAEVTPVGEIGSYRFTPGSVTHQMMEDYSAEVRRRSNH